MVGLLTELVRVPSVSGSEAEHDLQARLATILEDEGLASMATPCTGAAPAT
jgi:acetylornithine deacetylase/succinyl-diaminopimelate desuccinylase-like protein